MMDSIAHRPVIFPRPPPFPRCFWWQQRLDSFPLFFNSSFFRKVFPLLHNADWEPALFISYQNIYQKMYIHKLDFTRYANPKRELHSL